MKQRRLFFIRSEFDPLRIPIFFCFFLFSLRHSCTVRSPQPSSPPSQNTSPPLRLFATEKREVGHKIFLFSSPPPSPLLIFFFSVSSPL